MDQARNSVGIAAVNGPRSVMTAELIVPNVFSFFYSKRYAHSAGPVPENQGKKEQIDFLQEPKTQER